MPLLEMGARFYSPGLGSFSQADTVIGSALDPVSLNRYLYAHANPTSLIDPSGQFVPCNVDQYDGCAPGTSPVDARGAKAKPPARANGGMATTGGSARTKAGGARPPARIEKPGPARSTPSVVDRYWERWAATPNFAEVAQVGWPAYSFTQQCSNAPAWAQSPGCQEGSPFMMPDACDEDCQIARIDAVALIDPTGATSVFLAVHYCSSGDPTNCAINVIAAAPIIGKGVKPAKIAAHAVEHLGETAHLFRAVGVREFESVTRTGRFDAAGSSLEGRQFAVTLDEALRYADRDANKVAILRASVDRALLRELEYSASIDPFIFKNGVYTVQPEHSGVFHEGLKGVDHVE